MEAWIAGTEGKWGAQARRFPRGNLEQRHSRFWIVRVFLGQWRRTASGIGKSLSKPATQPRPRY